MPLGKQWLASAAIGPAATEREFAMAGVIT